MAEIHRGFMRNASRPFTPADRSGLDTADTVHSSGETTNQGRRAMTRWLIAGLAVAALIAAAPAAASEDTYSGSELWLHYVPVSDPALLAQYRSAVSSVVVE